MSRAAVTLLKVHSAAGCQKRINPRVSQLLAHSDRPARHGTPVPECVDGWPAARARETSAKTPTVGPLTGRHGGYVRPAPTVGPLTGRHGGYVRPAPTVGLLTESHGGYVRPAPRHQVRNLCEGPPGLGGGSDSLGQHGTR